MIKRFHIEVTGHVQGVGFRPHVHRLAISRGLSGWVQNSGGSVLIEVQGEVEPCLAFTVDLIHRAPGPARLRGLAVQEIPAIVETAGFIIQESRLKSRLERFVPPDIGICDDCLAELLDRRNRRYGYPFINCCHCGPRYTIVKALPYDRERTTMRSFHLCLDCRVEYESELDRRFHAEPNACRKCGPHYTYKDEAVSVAGQSSIDKAVEALALGKVLAVKGIGGFHLVCRAEDFRAVEKIRRIKQRPTKPMAVMAPDAAAAGRLGELGAGSEALLRDPDRPIVLLPAKPSPIASNIAPGLDTIGVMLPYAPVHVLLLRALGGPLVVTSANCRSQPIITDNDLAVGRLRGLADAWLYHNRKITNGCDDSIVRPAGARSLTLRAGRGRAPLPQRLAGRYRPIVGCGADLKASITLAASGWAHVSQYLGDLGEAECMEAYRSAFKRLCRLLEIAPMIAACDLHPDYMSSAFAAGLGLPLVKVQHHHAHVVSVMVEKGLDERVIGVAFDGSGWGEDGRVWGGEWLVCDRRSSVRSAHLKEVDLPGGEAAIKEPWRQAVAYLNALGLGAGEIAGLLPIDFRLIELVLKQIAAGFNTPITSSAGRLFDAVSALAGVCLRQSYEGEAASYLEARIVESEAGRPYEIRLDDRAPCHAERSEASPGSIEVDWRPLLAGLLADKQAGADPGLLAARFHDTVAASISLVSGLLREKEGINKVVLAGGVFANAYLTRRAVEGLSAAGFEVFVPEKVPVNDGGISLGQAGVAAAREG